MQDLENQDREITLKEVIIGLQQYIHFLWRYKWLIFLFSLFMMALGLVKSMLKPDSYSATLTFMINEDEGNSLPGMASVLGQFGLGGFSSSEYNLDKIIELAKSRRIVHKTILDSVEIEGKKNVLANQIINVYDLEKKWKKDSLLSNYQFTSNVVPNQTQGLSTNKALKYIYGFTLGDKAQGFEGLLKIGYNEATGIIQLSAKTEAPQLAIQLVESNYKYLSQFYVEKTTEKQRVTVGNLKQRVDSIRNALNAAEFQLAQIQDNSQGFQLNRDRILENKLQRQIQILVIAYGEALKNLETSSFLLENATPFFQIIDTPLPPIEPDDKKILRNTILIGFLGTILSVFFLSLWGLYKRVME